MAKELRTKGIEARVYSHLSAGAVRARIARQYKAANRRARKPIVLVGHSFGGNAALAVAHQLSRDNIPVKLVVTVDPTRGGPVANNVARYVNYYFDGGGLGASLKASARMPRSRVRNIDMRVRDDVVGAGDNHWSVTHNKVIQSEILKQVRRAAR
nr:alpha/beta fold hydrolase [Pseudohoeflea sp. DP4N28-3]